MVFAAIEIVLFAYVFGMDRGWDEIHRGADIKIPAFYKPVMKYVTPLFLFTLLGWWTVTEALPALLMQNVADPSQIPYRWLSRGVMVALLVIGTILIKRSWARRAGEEA